MPLKMLVSIVLCLSISGCSISYNPRPVVPVSNFINLKEGNYVAWMWLPNAKIKGYDFYRLAVNNYIDSGSIETLNIIGTESVNSLNQQSLERGEPIYSSKSGKLIKSNLNAYIQRALDDIHAKWPLAEYVIVADIGVDSIERRDGYAQWNNTEQRITDVNNYSSYDQINAVSLKLQYVNIKTRTFQTKIVGLDMTNAPREENSKKYKNIINFVFSKFG